MYKSKRSNGDRIVIILLFNTLPLFGSLVVFPQRIIIIHFRLTESGENGITTFDI